LESIAALMHALEDSPLAVSITESDWAFPAIESIHVIALALVIGTVCVVDLRLLGWASAKRSYRQLAREVLPWTWGAFCLSVISGGLMFITQAAEYYENNAFRIKMLLLLLAGINMLVFELLTARGAATWDQGRVPWRGKLAAALSLTLWVSIVFFGRRIGFTMIPE
jgi:Family of unknown function (DUF6644)